VMIAWDGTREAKRALHDAMPFLSHAGTVRQGAHTAVSHRSHSPLE